MKKIIKKIRLERERKQIIEEIIFWEKQNDQYMVDLYKRKFMRTFEEN